MFAKMTARGRKECAITDVSLSQADLFVVLWSCRKPELKGPGGRERSAASRATTGLVTEQKAALPSQASCFRGGSIQRAGSPQATETVCTADVLATKSHQK